MHAYPYLKNTRNIFYGSSLSLFHDIHGPPQKFIIFLISFPPTPELTSLSPVGLQLRRFIRK